MNFFISEHPFCIIYSENLNEIPIWITIRKFYMWGISEKMKKNKFSKWKVEIKGCLDNINALLNSWCSEESIMVLFLYVLTDNNGLLLEVNTQVCVLDLDRIKMICTLHDFFLFIHKMIWPKELLILVTRDIMKSRV